MVPMRSDNPTPGASRARSTSRADSDSASSPAGGRLNMMLSYGGWKDESWADRLPRLLAPLGVRTYRVSSGAEATRLLQSEDPIHLAIVDLMLPIQPSEGGRATTEGEGGPRLLQLLARLESPPPTIVVQRAGVSREAAQQLVKALAFGAFACVDRPVDLEVMLEVFRRALRRHYQDRWPDDCC